MSSLCSVILFWPDVFTTPAAPCVCCEHQPQPTENIPLWRHLSVFFFGRNIRTGDKLKRDEHKVPSDFGTSCAARTTSVHVISTGSMAHGSAKKIDFIQCFGDGDCGWVQKNKRCSVAVTVKVMVNESCFHWAVCQTGRYQSSESAAICRLGFQSDFICFSLNVTLLSGFVWFTHTRTSNFYQMYSLLVT